jgi:branched-chain amino acid transport system substrate-binding protein
MAGPAEIAAGASLSLSGRFRLQGQQARDGVRLWAEQVAGAGGLAVGVGGPARPVRLIVYDDESRADRARENVERLLGPDRVDLLLGPYSSGLTLAVAPLAEARGKLLWNHGGASDAILEQGWRHLVSVIPPASSYLRALPPLLKARDPALRRLAILHARRGSFATQVARGMAEAAGACGLDPVRAVAFESPLGDPAPVLAEALAGAPELLAAVGAFADDVAVVRGRAGLAGVKALAVVGAGLAAFLPEAGGRAEGVIGPSQWEPGVGWGACAGPDPGQFAAAFRARFGRSPEYPAAQAFAAGVVFAECLRRAGGLDDGRLLAAARRLEISTLLGPFRLDPESGAQVGHPPLLIQWQRGAKAIVWPEQAANAALAYPI